jgi:hypothetical protein
MRWSLVVAAAVALSFAPSLAGAVTTQPSRPETAHISPAPGVSFDVPVEWVACEDEYKGSFKSVPDTHGLKEHICRKVSEVPYRFRAFDPRLFKTVSMLVDQHEEKDLTEEELASITPDILSNITPGVCSSIVKPMTADGTTVESCKVELGTFAGHQALISTIIGVPPTTPEAKFQINIYELPYAHGYMQVQFNRPVMFVPTVQPVIDAVIASFKIE